MLRLLAIAAIVFLADVSAASSQTPPVIRVRHHHKAAEAPPPETPADPVTWMGQAVGHILEGKSPIEDGPSPAPK